MEFFKQITYCNTNNEQNDDSIMVIIPNQTYSIIICDNSWKSVGKNNYESYGANSAVKSKKAG